MSSADRSELWLVSPHSDDVAWSMADLAHSSGGFHERTLITVFTETDYVTDGSPRIRGAITERRRQEDAAFCRATGLSFVSCGLEDGLMRGYSDLRALFTVEDCRRDPIFTRVIDALAARIPDRANVCVIAPVGIGRHVDHAICREATKIAFRRAILLFYEDLPYVWWIDDTSLETHVIHRRLGANYRALLHIVEDPERRRRSAALYRSQPADLFAQYFERAALRLHDGRFVERFWSSELRERLERLPFLAGALVDSPLNIATRQILPPN